MSLDFIINSNKYYGLKKLRNYTVRNETLASKLKKQNSYEQRTNLALGDGLFDDEIEARNFDLSNSPI